MQTFEEIGEILDELAAELPREFFNELNGGINLLPETKFHPEAVAGDLYVLGEYRRDVLGRYINIYYGSIAAHYANYPPQELRDRLRQLLVHEFTHHIESLAGERGLEDKDERDMEQYRDRWSGGGQ